MTKANDEQDPNVPKGSGMKFVRVSHTRPIAGAALRGKPNATVWRSGRSVLNVEATEGFDMIAIRAGADPEQCATDFGVNEDAGSVAIYPMKANTPGTMPVRRQGITNCVIYLNGVFHRYPNLRVPGTRECAVTREVDEDGVECLVVGLAAGLMKQKGTRKKNAGGAATQGQAKATEQTKAPEQSKASDQGSAPDGTAGQQ